MGRLPAGACRVLRDEAAGVDRRHPDPVGVDAEKLADPAPVVPVQVEQRSEPRVVEEQGLVSAAELYTPGADRSAGQSSAAPELPAQPERAAPPDAA
jgi:hypothetical protein